MPELKLENSLVDGRYEVYERLSRGSYAEIFVARDREFGGREVVIKALNTSLQGTPDGDLERTLIENFQNEAVALDSVRHPHVILRWGHGTAADLRGVPFHYLVLEYMPGGDLLELCRKRLKKALQLDETLFYFRQLCEGLAYAHSQGVIHRDLKPNNFLLSADHRLVKIADFGVAKITSDDDSEVTRVGADIYAPPEHHPEERVQFDRLTAAADIYSLAKSFYTVLCGRAPSQFKCDPIASLPEPMIRDKWAEPLLAVLRRATEDDPKERYASVIEFWSELAQVAAVSEDESIDEDTSIKPRLKVNPGTLPQTPLQPEFEPALASSGSLAEVPSATPVIVMRKDDEERVEVESGDLPDGRPGRFFIDLQKSNPVPAVQTGLADPKSVASVASGVKTEIALEAKAEPKIVARPEPPPSKLPPATQKHSNRFSETIRRRIFIAFLALALFGSLVSVFNYVRGQSGQNLPFGFGPPTVIEINSPSLNVRAGPSMQDPVLGAVLKGSRHQVLAQSDKNWIQIQVGQWNETIPHVTDQNQGWVYGNPDYVRVVSRRLW